MPFISSVSGSSGGRIWPSSRPTVTVSSTTNFNQNRATFNGTVSANGSGTSFIKFQVSPDSGVNWYDAVGGTSISNTVSQNVSVYYNATGYKVSGVDTNLAAGTTYLVRLSASNSGGVSNSSTTSFTTWSLKTRTYTANDSFAIPTITPTGGSALVPTVYDIFVVGGGGGSARQAGGGGGYSVVASQAFTDTSNLTLTVTVGAGGTAGSTTYDQNGNATTVVAGNGGSSSVSSSSFTTISANGGKGGDATTQPGYSGNGNAPGNTVTYSDTSGKIPGYTIAYGGGGGSSAIGSNGTVAGNVYGGTATGGTGGAGYTSTVYSIGVGGGGGGGAGNDGGSEVGGTPGTPRTYGGGANGAVVDGFFLTPYTGSAGGSGYVAFRYYGP